MLGCPPAALRRMTAIALSLVALAAFTATPAHSQARAKRRGHSAGGGAGGQAGFVKLLDKDAMARGASPTPDGGCIVCGGVTQKGLFAAKLDRLGNVTWENYYGTTGWPIRDESMGYDIRPTTDGGYILTGWKLLPLTGGGTQHIMVVTKLDAKGVVGWEKQFPFKGELSRGVTVRETPDGGFFACGWTPGSYTIQADKKTVEWQYEGGVYVIKLDKNGEKSWDKLLKTIMPQHQEEKSHMAARGTDGYYVAYTYARPEGENGVNYPDATKIVRLSEDGQVVWERELSYELGNWARATGIEGTSDGGAVIVGNTETNKVVQGTRLMGFAVKINHDGNWQWKRLFGRLDEKSCGENRPYSVRQTQDGGLILSGETRASWPKAKYGTAWIVRLGPDGTVLWDKIYGREGTSGYLFSASQAPDGGYVAAGYMDKELSYPYVIKTDANGGAKDEIVTTYSKIYEAAVP